MVKQTEPNLDSWKEQEDRQRTSSWNRRLGALAVAAAIVTVGVVAAIVTRSNERDDVPPVATGSNEAPQVQTLSIVDVGTGEGTAFTAPLGSSGFAFTLDGSMVAYTDADKDGNDQVFVMNADGSNARQLTFGEGGARGPIWAPDGSLIAYERDTSDKPQIFEVRVAGGGGSTKLTNEPRGAVDPGGWAPDGGSIVYSSINTEGHRYTARLLDFKAEQSMLIVPDASTPALSPDGASIAFNSWLQEPVVRLILANSDGSDRRTIARFDNVDAYEKWSPDSTQLAYIGSTEDNGFGTYVYDLATGETRFVSEGTVESWIDADHILVS
jgi:TolB protein